MPDIDSRTERTRLGKEALRVMSALLVLGLILGFGLAYYYRSKNTALSTLFSTAAVTLLYGSLLGGIVTQLFADVDRRRVQRASEIQFITNVLADLKSVYDQVERGRTLIKAHRSAKTYGDELRGLIDARVKLQNVDRALQVDDRRTPILSTRANVVQMKDYLKKLLEEFEEKYKAISIQQSVFEANMKRALEPPPPKEPTAEALPSNTPWDALMNLPRLTDFLKPVLEERKKANETVSDYQKEFLRPLNAASKVLRDAIADLLSR